MTIETLDKELENATNELLEIARSCSWNTISSDCRYILSEIDDDIDGDFFKLRKIRKRNNEWKDPRSLLEIVDDLKQIYTNLYDLNLYVYKAKPKFTIIEIQYYPKSLLDKDYFEQVKNNHPMLHCKVAIPPYSQNKEKFDINWELGGLRHGWKLFWWRQKIKKI